MNTVTAGKISPLSEQQTVTAQPRLATLFSTIIALLALMASAGGLFWDGLYRDNMLVTAAFRGNDLITLVVAVPGLLIALLMARRGSAQAHLVGLGLLAYMLYNYVFYLYGAAFNRLFLLYVVLVSLSIMALIISMFNLRMASRIMSPACKVFTDEIVCISDCQLWLMFDTAPTC